jgi:signal transduction histidine kinase
MTRKIIDLIQNASTLAKLEEGQKLSVERKDLCDMMRGAVDDHLSAAKERGMTIELKAGGPCPARVNSLVGDVFSNLISNAVKYGAEGSAVHLSIEEKEGSWIVAVADRGEGIPDGEKEAVFTRFSRRAKEGVKGTGLGLSIVKKVVEAHRGRVWVEDNPGGGSVFLVELPREEE